MQGSKAEIVLSSQEAYAGTFLACTPFCDKQYEIGVKDANPIFKVTTECLLQMMASFITTYIFILPVINDCRIEEMLLAPMRAVLAE